MVDAEDRSVLTNTGRLLEFLAAVAREVQSRPVRDFRNHEFVLLPDGVPEHSRVRLGPRAGDPAWLTVPRLEEPARPPLPPHLEGFVNVASLEDLDGIPSLRLELDHDEHKEERTALDDWTQDLWLDWATRTKPIREARRLYQRVLELRLLLQRQQATHEIVWGHAVLGIDRAGGVLAPLLITRVQVVLDEDSGALSIVPESVPELELDPVEGMNLQGMGTLAQLRSAMTEEPPIDPWDSDALDALNRRLTAPLGLDASVSESMELPIKPQGALATRAWMVVVRPRPARHQRFYDDLAEVLKERDFLPEALASVVALESDLDRTMLDLGLADSTDWTPVGERLLMPLPTNDEQERIARQLASSRGVTVQGPPGTGKSHTIVNLVSHLMAHGKRVLVTAQNEQALQVLRDKFPPELRDLTVSVLGSSPDHMDALRASIQAVLDIASRVDPAAEAGPIAELEAQLDRVREDLRRAELSLVDALRDEEREFPLPTGTHKAPDVAQWVSAHASHFGRVIDPITQDTTCPISPSEYADLVLLTRTLDTGDLAEYSLSRPRSHDLPSVSELQSQTERLHALQDLLADLEVQGLNLERVASTSEEELTQLSDELSRASQRLENLRSRWTKSVCTEIRQSADNATLWSTIIDKARTTLSGIQQVKRQQVGHEIELPEGDARTVSAHLSELSQRFNAGKGVPKFLNSDLRTFYAQCRVDGAEPRTVTEIELLEAELRARQLEQSLHSIFRQASEQVPLPTPDRGPGFVSSATQVLKDLEDAQDWETAYRTHLRTLVDAYFTQPISTDDPVALAEACRALAQGAAQREAERIDSELKSVLETLASASSRPGSSRMWTELHSALTQRQWPRWQKIVDESERLSALGPQIEKWTYLYNKLAEVAPLWAHALRDTKAEEGVAGDPAELVEMWRWRQARTWLKRLHASVSIDRLMTQAQDLQKESERLVVQIAQRSTAVAVHRSLNDQKRRALTSWQQALQRYGKGTGKNASHYMQVARSQLPTAMGAIPAWIMPIHRVIDNFDPRVSELFDVVIVDESSQCDLLSVGVLALGRKSVVVGDDKQTSPAAVGVDTGRIQELQNSYLAGIEQRQLLTADESLYGLAERVFPSVILLREHFRCLPEIIRFSNRYYDDRILPLREPLGYDIGEPLRVVRVHDGVRSGSSTNASNHVEAQALVDQVIECHLDPRYEDLTFGVVTMQGNLQAQIIQAMLIDQLGFEAFEARDLRVGSPAAFQGDERDVIFISVVADDNSYQAVRNPDKQRVNVAASRAKDQLWIFHSMDPATLNHQDQRRALIEYAMDGGKTYVPQANQLDACESNFERDVLRDIVGRGHEVFPQYPVGSYRIDLVVDTPNGRIAVECDGDRFHGPEQYENDLRRQRVLERLGWSFWRVRASEYYLDPGEAMASLWVRLEQMAERAAWRSFPVTVGQPEVEPTDGNWSDDPQESAESEDSSDLVGWEPEVFHEEDESISLNVRSDRREVEVQESASWTELIGRGADYSFGDDDRGLWIFSDESEQIVGVPMSERDSGEKHEGEAIPCLLGFDNVGVNFVVVEWADGSGEVRATDITNGGSELARLGHGGRLGFYVLEDGSRYCEIRIMRHGNREYATAHNPEPGEFKELLGWSLSDFLTNELHVQNIGTRAKLLDDDTTRKSTPVVIWDGEGPDVPAFLYVASRIFPLMSMDGDY
jgi:very-short-patch-repair endonuclease